MQRIPTDPDRSGEPVPPGNLGGLQPETRTQARRNIGAVVLVVVVVAAVVGYLWLTRHA